MKSLTPIIAITIAMMLSVPAAAQVVYNNGPINGNNDAWTINLTFASAIHSRSRMVAPA